MKIICSKNELLKGVNTVSKAVPVRTTFPILECILIEAGDDGIRLTANDMELGIETVIEGTVEETGMIALDARIFSDIVRKLPDNDVVIQTGDTMMTDITCEKARFSILGKDAEEFSPLPQVEKTKALKISEFSLKELIRQTIFSISDSENNKIMTGELFEVKENILKVVSLDGHRISIRRIELAEVYEDIRVIVPGKSLIEISKILSGELEDLVFIYFTQNHILFEFGSTKVVSRLIEGEYFKIEQMISSAYDTKVKVNKKEFLSCIDRASLLVKENDKKPIILNITDEMMQLKIRSFIGSMDEEITIEKEGNDIMIGFNPRFFMDALRAIDDEEVTFYMVNPKAPCFIRDEEESYIYLILPVNFNAADV